MIRLLLLATLIATPATAQRITAPARASVDLSNVPTQAEVDAKVAAAQRAIEDEVTRRLAAMPAPAMPDLSPYALKTQIPTVTGMVTAADVAAQIATATASLATKTAVSTVEAKIPDTTGMVRATDVASQIATATAPLATKSAVSALDAKIPVPATAVPPTEMVGGTAGTAGTYRPGDAAAPRITRAGTSATTNTIGEWAITFKDALAQVPVVIPMPVNTTTQPIVCNVATRSTTGATGRCWLARSLPAVLTLVTNLISYDVFASPASGITVQILAIPPTQ
jgi:hypothetical protein